MADGQCMLTLEPLELVFTDVHLHQARPTLRHVCEEPIASLMMKSLSYGYSTRIWGDAAGILIYNPGIYMYCNEPEAEAPTCAQAYTQTLTLTNNLRATVEATIRAGSPERYTLSPASLALRPGQSVAVEVVLRVLKYAARRKAAQAGQRDIFHVRVTAPPLWMLRALRCVPATTRPGAAGACSVGSAAQPC